MKRSKYSDIIDRDGGDRVIKDGDIKDCDIIGSDGAKDRDIRDIGREG